MCVLAFRKYSVRCFHYLSMSILQSENFDHLTVFSPTIDFRLISDSLIIVPYKFHYTTSDKKCKHKLKRNEKIVSMPKSGNGFAGIRHNLGKNAPCSGHSSNSLRCSSHSSMCSRP